VLIEAVENHMPQAIVIDEIGTKLEAMAASTIAQRGIQLVASAHGLTIENLTMNPSLDMLVGGIQSVTLGDEEASRRRVQKTVLERKGPSTFAYAVEIVSKTELRVHRSLEATVDALLAGRMPNVEIRKLGSTGSVQQEVSVQKDQFRRGPYEIASQFEVASLSNARTSLDSAFNIDSANGHIENSNVSEAGFNLYAYGISEEIALQAIKQLELEDMITLTYNISEADAVIALQSKLKKNSQIQAVLKSEDIPVFFAKTNSLVQITRALRVLVDDHVDGLIDVEDNEEVRSSVETDALEVPSSQLTCPGYIILEHNKTVSLITGSKIGSRASSDPERGERAAPAQTVNHHLLPSEPRRNFQPQVGSHRQGAERLPENPPAICGQGRRYHLGARCVTRAQRFR
uniref:Phosphotyrosine protein phosphatase domain-containing protein n=2 Tax=Aegilops tauschii subsp. strangulata TaxID=200361 RepID=A0A453QR54_AEGTS